MTDEERKAVDKMEKLIKYLKDWNKDFTIVPKDAKYFETILNMIKNYQRMINEMAEIIEECRQNDCLDVSNLDFGEIAGTEKIIEYFEKKVEEN